METPLGSFYWTILLFAFLGVVASWLYRNDPYDMFWGLVGGILVGLLVWFKGLVKYLRSDLFFAYPSETSSIVVEKETCVLALTIPEHGTHQIRGLSVEEWCDLAQKVLERGFTTRSGLGDYYNLTRDKLLRVGVLVENSKGGVDVTDHVGKHFFNQLKKGDYKILNILPHPEDESV